MTWVKLDDGFDDHPKIRALWMSCPPAVGLHVMALAYCARNLTDGLVHAWYVAEKAPEKKRRDLLIQALENAGLWHPKDDGWELHDFLDYNPPASQVLEKRRVDSERKRRGRQRGIRAESVRPVPVPETVVLPTPLKGSPLGAGGMSNAARGQHKRHLEEVASELP